MKVKRAYKRQLDAAYRKCRTLAEMDVVRRKFRGVGRYA